MAAPTYRSNGAGGTITTTSTTITKPAGLADGDVMYAVVANGGTNVAPTTVPSGWDLRASASISTTFWGGIYERKVASAAGEPADYTWSGFVDSCAGAMVAVVGSDPTTPTHKIQATPNVNGNVNCTSITPTVPDCLIIGAVAVDDNQGVTDASWACATNPAALTERIERLSSGGNDTAVAMATAPQTVTGATGTLTATLAGTRDNISFLIAVQPPAAGLSATVNQVTETDTAQSVGRSKTTAVAQVVETDTAGLISEAKSTGRAVETDTAGAVAVLRTELVGQAIEADTAQPITRSGVAVSVGQVTEVDTAGALTSVKLVTLGRASETDTAGVVSHHKTEQLGVAAEVDSAGVVTAAHADVVGQVTETDVANALGRAKSRGLGPAGETDTAQPVGGGAAQLTGQAAETDTAGALTSAKITTVGQPGEVDTAGVVTGRKTGTLGQATETDTANPLSVSRTEVVGQAGEVNQAGAILTAHAREIGVATEVDTAGAITGSGGAQPPVPEVDLMTLAFIVVTGVGQCVVDELAETAAGSPARQCLAVPGDIAWDNCECGQFAQTITTDTPSKSFPVSTENESFERCGPPLLVMSVTASTTRCVPGVDDNGHPPSCAALLDAARVLETDREAMRRAITCCLRDLYQANRITNYAVGVGTAVGPLGGCAGVNMSYRFGVNYTCC